MEESWATGTRRSKLSVVGAGAVVTGAGSLHLTDQVKNDIDLHKKNYGENCDNPALYKQCVFDRQVINHDSDRANTLANVSLGTAIAGRRTSAEPGGGRPHPTGHPVKRVRAVEQVGAPAGQRGLRAFERRGHGTSSDDHG